MGYFHSMIGQLVQMDNGGLQHMTMDMMMNIGLMMKIRMVFKTPVSMVIMSGLMRMIT